jgi:hypothetical protein
VPDQYEPDNTPADATVFVVGTSQDHNLCSVNTQPDEDWVFFADGRTTVEYTVETFIWPWRSTQSLRSGRRRVSRQR